MQQRIPNKSFDIASFDGIFRRTKIYRHPNQKWYIKQVTSKTNELLLGDKAMPTGRHNWAYLSSTNTHGENLTLSVCKFGNVNFSNSFLLKATFNAVSFNFRY